MLAFTFAALMFAPLQADKEANRPVKPEQLTKTILKANRIVVLQSPRNGSRELFASEKRADIESFAAAVEVAKPRSGFHCMCDGTPAVHLYDGEKLLVSLTNHHGRSVRCSMWRSDAMLKDAEKWLKWFDDRKIRGPRIEFQQLEALQVKHGRQRAKWLAAKPKGLTDRQVFTVSIFGDTDTTQLQLALTEAYPDKSERIRALLHWYGSGAGPWSGFPHYESLAEELLLAFDTPAIVSAIGDDTTTKLQLVGAARLIGGYTFGVRRKADRATIPAEIKAVLWDSVKETTDKDIRSRARRALNPAG